MASAITIIKACWFTVAIATLSFSVFAQATDKEITKPNTDTKNISQPIATKKASTEDQLNHSQKPISANTSEPSNAETTNQIALTDNKAEINWLFLHPYQASYDVFSDGDIIGSANRRLIKNDIKAQSHWKLEMTTKLKKWMLSLKSHENFQFKITSNQLYPLTFYSSSKVTFKSAKVIEQYFNWDKKVEMGKRKKAQWELPIEHGIFDRMSHIVMLRGEVLSGIKVFDYQVSYKGRRKNYHYEIAGNETIKTPFGNIETIRLNRIKGDESSFSIWLGKDYNYLPIKIAQFEQDKPSVELVLNKFNYFNEKAD